MLNPLWWLLVVEAVGLAAFPLAFRLIPGLRDRGYSVSKPLGLLLIGYASWILSQLHLVPSVRLSLAAVLLVMAALSGRIVWTRRAEMMTFLREQWRVIVISEVVFLIFFAGWTLYRAYDPAINHTEQPMDFAFLNASIQTTTGAPQDPWLSGAPVSYYYFGYWMMGALSELTGIASNLSYNLAMALVPAMSAQAVFGLAYGVIRSQAYGMTLAVAGSIGAVLMLGIAANLEGALEFIKAGAMGSQGFWDWIGIEGLTGPLGEPMRGWTPEEFWWWFRATRVINTFDGAQWIDYTIQEFPFFSHLLGDLHPHVMSVPFALLVVAFCWDLYRRDFDPRADWRRQPGSYAHMLAVALALGGLAFTNMWDLPTYSALLLAVAAIKSYSLRTRDPGAPWTAPLLIAAGSIALAFLLFLPYYLTLRVAVGGIAPVQAAATRPVHLAVVWGLHLAVIAPFIVGAFWRSTLSRGWGRAMVVALGIAASPVAVWALLHTGSGGAAGDVPGRLFGALPLVFLIAVAVHTALQIVRREGPTGTAFALAVSALALMLIMGPELLFVVDSFGTRMNTLFKLYYQAWTMLSVPAGLVFCHWIGLRERLSGWKRAVTTAWAAVVSLLLVASLYYAPAAAASKAAQFSGSPTLDGLAYLAQLRPDERDAIEFMRTEADPDTTIMEAVGEWFEFGLISRSTGVPTVFNWPGHEVQWRGSAAAFGSREQDVADVYESMNWEHAKNLMARYGVEYVYVGPRETAKYGTEGLDKFREFMDVAFSSGGVTIFRVR